VSLPSKLKAGNINPSKFTIFEKNSVPTDSDAKEKTKEDWNERGKFK